MLDQDTGETLETTLKHQGDTVRDFYAALRRPVVVGDEATGSMGWLLTLMEVLGITCRVGYAGVQTIAKSESFRRFVTDMAHGTTDD